eukprot:s3514_g4.t1
MTAVELLIKALDETERFLTAQKDLDCFPQVLDQQCAAMLRRCQQLPGLTGDEAARLITEIQSKLGSMCTVSPLVLAISTRVAQADSRAGNEKRPKQTLTNFTGYTASDMQMLSNKATSSYSKLDHIAVRMVRLGLDVPTERTAGHVLKLLGIKTHLHRIIVNQL